MRRPSSRLALLVLVLALSATGLTGVTAAAAGDPASVDPAGGGLVGQGVPLAFEPRGLTTPRFAVAAEPEVVDLTAHDGILLHTRVFRPDTSADPAWRTPVILVLSPYYHGLALGNLERSMDLVERFTPLGYTVVLADLRGTGFSGGCGSQDGADQARDLVTLVEHFADEPWSNGRVGTYGKSYDAESQHAGAVLDPRGLETMVSVAGISSLYDVAAFDGVPLLLNGPLSAGAYALYDVDVPEDPAYLPQRAERHTCQPANVVEATAPDGDMDAYWAERDFRHRAAEVTASMLYVTGLGDGTVTPINLDGWVDEVDAANGDEPVKAIIGQWGHFYPYDAPDRLARDDWYDTVHAWFDAELLDLPTGVQAWPDVQVQSEQNVWRAVDAVEGMGVETPVPLGERGDLGPAATFEEAGSAAVVIDAPARHLSGQALLDTVITLDRPDGHLAIALQELRADGSARTLTTGYLSATHRESLVRQIPVTPGHPTPYHLRTYPFDATLDEGSRLRLTIAGSDGSTVPAGTGYTATWHLDRTVLRLPVADDRCGLAVAQRTPAEGEVPGCAGGVPTAVPWTDVPRSAGHATTFRPVGPEQAETIAGVAAVRQAGYLLVRDGVELAAEVIRPAEGGPHPTLFTYDGYAAGADPDAGYAARYLPRGYALVGVNLRGTGCSGGTFDFFQPAEAHDGYEVVEWIADQPWSDGAVAMIGKSYPGITQLFVAETRPPSLVAISPGHHFADAYRDIAFPGGIFNYSFAALWSFVAQPSPGYAAVPGDVLAGDATCLAHQEHHARNVPTNPFVQAQSHPHDDLLIRERSPLYAIDRIEVPVFQVMSWQDEQLMSRNTHVLSAMEAAGVPYRAVLGNGDHGTYREEPQLVQLDRFLEAHLERRPVLRDGTPLARYLAEPPITVMWEQGEATAPRWSTAHDSWTDVAEPWALWLTGDGGLSTSVPQALGTPVGYTHSAVGQQGNAYDPYGGTGTEWWTAWTPPPGSQAAFTSEAFTVDTPLLGPASADLWITATAPNVDLQVTLTEVRPDGSEVFVNQGWLRADQRRLDRSETTDLRPVQTHYVADVEPLSATDPSLVRVEVFPFGHLVRAGSRLRLWVGAPTTVPQLQAFALDPTPAEVQIHTGDGYGSRLVLPRAVDAPVPAEVAGQAGQPACGVVQRQPCRPDPLA